MGLGPLSALEFKPEAVFLRGVPGEKITTYLSLHNDSTLPLRVILETHNNPSDRPWLKLSLPSVRLRAGEVKVVRLAAKIPDHRGEVTAEIWARSETDKMTETRLVRRVVARVAGTEIYDARLEEVQVRSEQDAVAVSAELENRGNVSLRPKLVAQLTLRDGSSARVVRDLTDKPLAPGTVAHVRLDTALSPAQWNGGGDLSVYFREEGTTTQVIKKFGESSHAP